MAVRWPSRPQKLALSTATHPTQNSRDLSTRARALLLPGALFACSSPLFFPVSLALAVSSLLSFPSSLGFSGCFWIFWSAEVMSAVSLLFPAYSHVRHGPQCPVSFSCLPFLLFRS